MHEQGLRQVDLNLLVVLRTLLETRSVSRSAQRLGMSQPAVSRSLAALRAAFGDPLLVKSGATMQPTARALEMTEPLQNVLAAVSGFLRPPDQFDPTTTERVFRIATTDYGATVVLPPLGRAFYVQAPGAGLEIVPLGRQSFADLGSGDLDLVLYSDNPVPGALRTRDLFSESFACLVRTGHPAAASSSKGRLSLDDFLAWSHILVTVTGGRTGPVDEALAAVGHRRKIGLWLPYFATAALVAARSDLILTMPRRAAEAFGAMSSLELVQPPIELSQFSYRIVWHERVHNEPAHAWLRHLIAEAARDQVP
jgi:DNA-binding transcriptional LysR family regulator